MDSNSTNSSSSQSTHSNETPELLTNMLPPTIGDTKSPKRLLHLFCGTISVGAVYRAQGFEVTTLDFIPKWKADIQEDILDWNYRVYESGYFHTIVCGVPCTEFSIAKTVGVRNLVLADKIVLKTLKLLNICNLKNCGCKTHDTGCSKPGNTCKISPTRTLTIVNIVTGGTKNLLVSGVAQESRNCN